jgi:hypothetical protein
MAQAKLIHSLEDFGEIFYFPPFHPGCRCVPIAVSHEEASEIVPEAAENAEIEIIPEDDDPLIDALRKIPDLPELTDKEAFKIWTDSGYVAINSYFRKLPYKKTDIWGNSIQHYLDDGFSYKKINELQHKMGTDIARKSSAAILKIYEKFKNAPTAGVESLYRGDLYAATKIFTDAEVLPKLKKLAKSDESLESMSVSKDQSLLSYLKEKLVGKTYADSGYMAASKDIEVAKKFVQDNEDEATPVQRKFPVIFRITGNVRYIDINELLGEHGMMDEKEMLLNRNSTMEITNITVERGSYLVVDWTVK